MRPGNVNYKMSEDSSTMLYANMRSMMGLIDRLRDFGLDSYISLPRIAVLGEQSAGKSSLLEAICGLNFLPRGTGIVTRRPLELRMVRAEVAAPYFTFPQDFGDKRFTACQEIVATIEALTDRETQHTKTVSPKPIVCTVHSSAVPDLTLVDLPGITRNPVAGQPANIEEITKSLVTSYCQDENTLILCVIPANIDLSTSDALSLARRIDKTGARTLGVLTKIDIMDEGADCREVLLNRVIPLRHGYVGVRGRSQLDMQGQVLVAEAVRRETEFFSRHPIYSSLPAELLGTRALVDRLSTILQRMIHAYLPRLKAEVSARLRRVRGQLEALGEEFPGSEEKKLELIFKLVRQFKDNFDQAVNGRYFHQKAARRRERKEKDAETITFQLDAQFGELFRKFSAPEFRVSADLLDEQIERALETYQSSSIPGFYSIDSFLALIHPKIEQLKDPVFHLLEECKGIIEAKGVEQIDGAMKKFTRLHVEVKEAFTRSLVHARNVARRVLESLVRAEENYLFTTDPAMVEVATVDRSLGVKALQVQEMRLRIDNYFAIVVRNLRDFVPKIIGQFLVRQFNAGLEVELLNALSKKNYCVDSLTENEVSQSLRAKLSAELSALYNADNLLVTSTSGGYVAEKDAGGGESPGPGMIDIQQLNDEFLQFSRELMEKRASRDRGGSNEGENALRARYKSSSVAKRPYVVVAGTPDKNAKPPVANGQSGGGAEPEKKPALAGAGSSWLNPFASKSDHAVGSTSTVSAADEKPRSNDPFDVPLLQGAYVMANAATKDPRGASGLSLTNTLNSFSKVFNSVTSSTPATQRTNPQVGRAVQAVPAKRPNTGSLFGDQG